MFFLLQLTLHLIIIYVYSSCFSNSGMRMATHPRCPADDPPPLASIPGHCSPGLNLQLCPPDGPLYDILPYHAVVFLHSSFPSPCGYVPSVVGSLHSFFQHAHFIRVFTILPIRHFFMHSSSVFYAGSKCCLCTAFAKPCEYAQRRQISP